MIGIFLFGIYLFFYWYIKMKHFISSESVTCWHPDKVCDQISDAILDACLSQDKESRVACECLATKDWIVLAGEITTNAKLDFEDIARQTLVNIWYNSMESFFDGNNCKILNFLHKQSPDIAMWVDKWWAGDQGIMFGFACDETEQLMPAPIFYAHRLAEKLEQVRKDWTLDYLLPDGKTQVTIEYDGDKPVRIDAIVVSNQHKKNISQTQLQDGIRKEVIEPILGKLVDGNTKIYINPTGLFEIWWPYGDSWLTGRKIIVDTYWGIGRHGGGAFSGKDPSKVDRSAAYMARYLAKNIVASGVCKKCEIQLSYAIWVIQPVSIHLDCFGTEKVAIEKIIKAVQDNFDLSPNGIIEKLDLKKAWYLRSATYGHFGRDFFSWEQTDSVDIFKTHIM